MDHSWALWVQCSSDILVFGTCHGTLKRWHLHLSEPGGGSYSWFDVRHISSYHPPWRLKRSVPGYRRTTTQHAWRPKTANCKWSTSTWRQTLLSIACQRLQRRISWAWSKLGSLIELITLMEYHLLWQLGITAYSLHSLLYSTSNHPWTPSWETVMILPFRHLLLYFIQPNEKLHSFFTQSFTIVALLVITRSRAILSHGS